MCQEGTRMMVIPLPTACVSCISRGERRTSPDCSRSSQAPICNITIYRTPPITMSLHYSPVVSPKIALVLVPLSNTVSSTTCFQRRIGSPSRRDQLATQARIMRKSHSCAIIRTLSWSQLPSSKCILILARFDCSFADEHHVPGRTHMS